MREIKRTFHKQRKWICPNCGAEVLVTPTPQEEYDDVINRFKERQNKEKQNE